MMARSVRCFSMGIVFWLGLAAAQADGRGGSVTQGLPVTEVRKWLSALPETKAFPELPESHPDYPALSAIRALKDDFERQPREVITRLEAVLPQVRYQALVQNEASSGKLFVGTVGSYDLWRDLIYVLLGRGYYATDRDKEALFYYNAVPAHSGLRTLAVLERNWVNLRLEKYGDARKGIEEIDSRVEALPAAQREEARLQRAFVLLKEGKAEEAAQLADAVKVDRLESLRLKVSAQALHKQYLNENKGLAFAQKKRFLERIIQVCEKLPARARDAKFAYMTGETYWHYASALRIEDPNKYRREWEGALVQADKWLKPWVDASIQQGKPLLSEDAMFFSVAILWEREQMDDAIPRLNAIARFFPLGEYREDTYQLLGDHYYDVGEFDAAIRNYTKLVQIGSPEKSAYGVYKAAWAFYNKQEKWTALRHLERLTLHYAEAAGGGEAADREPTPGSLVLESQKDMLLVMAEMMPVNGAIQELQMFPFSKARREQLYEQLAGAYKSIGKYNDAIGLWQNLLASGGNSQRQYGWLSELVDVALASGNRAMLAKMLDYYISRLPARDSSEATEGYQKLVKELVKITLSVHREAKKSDDADIWASTDVIYATVSKQFPDLSDGEFWFFGAQRKEKLEKRWEAVKWYRQAGDTAGYTGAQEAALSVLRILREAADGEKNRPSADAKAALKIHEAIADGSQWYIERFNATKERGLAEFLFIEALSRTKDSSRAENYLVGALEKEGATVEHQSQYLSYNHHLYADKRWEAAYRLAVRGGEALAKNGKATEFLDKLRKFQQEAAFQVAFTLEKANQDKGAIREWYEKATEVAGDTTVLLKAWHNLLVTYDVNREPGKIIDQFEKLEKQMQAGWIRAKLDREQSDLQFENYVRLAKAYQADFKPLKKAETLLTASRYKTGQESDAIRWDAALIFGAYYQVNAMRKEITALVERRSPIVLDANNQIDLARLYFWGGDFDAAWKIVRPVVSGKSPLPTSLMLLRDLYAAARREKHPLYKDLRAFLETNYPALKVHGMLQPLWAELLYPNFDGRKLVEWDRERTQATGSGGRKPSAVDHLKARLADVTAILASLEERRTGVRKYLASGAPQVSVAAVCITPRLSKRAASHLKRLLSPAVESTQWPDFVRKLQAKVTELEKVSEKEQANCDKQKVVTAYMASNPTAPSTLCRKAQECFPNRPANVNQVNDLENEWNDPAIARLDKVEAYIRIGAWAPAEILAFSAPSVHERSLLLGYIRLAVGDMWNALPLFQEAAKDPKLASQSELFLAYAALKNGYRDVASQRF
ncbi:MAG: tol-pal system YbgF family protein, partial [Bacteriovoracia bacterium]